jgi:hypothetical protein
MDKEKACVVMTLVECLDMDRDDLVTCERFGKVLSFLVTGYTPGIEDLEMMVRKPSLDISEQLIPSKSFTKEYAGFIARIILSAQALRWSGEMVPQYNEQVVAVIEWPYFLILTLCLTLSVISWIMVALSTRRKRSLPVPTDVWEGIQVGILECHEQTISLVSPQNDRAIPARTSTEPFLPVEKNLVYGAKTWSKDSLQLGITVAPLEVPDDTHNSPDATANVLPNKPHSPYSYDVPDKESEVPSNVLSTVYCTGASAAKKEHQDMPSSNVYQMVRNADSQQTPNC